MDNISFARHQFPLDIIRRAVWLYARFTLSYRDIEGLPAERGLNISYHVAIRTFGLTAEHIDNKQATNRADFL
jgi:putative transposase